MKDIEYSKKWIKHYREKEMKMTQKELAEYLSLGIRTIQNWETRGATDQTIKLLQLIWYQNRKINTLRKQLEDSNMTFTLEK